MKPAPIWLKSINFGIGGVNFSPSVYEALVIVFLLFVLVLSLARLRHLFIKWSFSAWPAFFFLGLLFALIIEGFLMIGGRTFFTVILGWRNAPKPILSVLDSGREKLVDVLGVKSEIPESVAKQTISKESVVSDYQSLSPNEAQKVRLQICEPQPE